MNSFVALDVETANPDYSSICAIGAARFEGGLVTDEWYRLVDPGVDFYWKNVEIHGIRAEDVDGRPRFVDLASEMQEFVDGGVVVHHGHFDRNAIAQACERWQLPPPPWEFRDSAQLARLAWPQFAKRGYNLRNLCAEIGHELLHHHNALDDARAAGAVFLEATKRLGAERLIFQRGFWLDYDQLLVGEVIVFSNEAAKLREQPEIRRALQLCKIQDRVRDRTTILVISDEEWLTERKTTQRLRAESRQQRGQRLLIMSETDFLTMIENS